MSEKRSSLKTLYIIKFLIYVAFSYIFCRYKSFTSIRKKNGTLWKRLLELET